MTSDQTFTLAGQTECRKTNTWRTILVDDADIAHVYEEHSRNIAISLAANGAHTNKRLGKQQCIVCGEVNDRRSRSMGWDVCIDCRETPGWHLREDGI